MVRVVLLVLMILGCLTVPVCSQLRDELVEPPQGQRVFFASHSGMRHVPDPLAELAESANIKGHKNVGIQMLRASKTIEHWVLREDKNQAKKALKAGEVDVFVMSPITFPDEGVENFVKLGLEHNPKMRFLVQITWGSADIDNQDFPKGAFAYVDREKTPDQIAKLYERNIKAAEAQADEINKKYGEGKKVLFLVPSAQALVALRTRIAHHEVPGLTKQGDLFIDIMSHPSAPMEALNTYLHYAVLYDRSPVGLPMLSLLKKAKREAWDEKLNRTLQELAWETAGNYSYSGVTATKHCKTQDKPKELIIVQVRNEVHLPGRSSSEHVKDYSSIVKDGWYTAADESFRVRIPLLQSGKINVLRRRWENPDGIDVKFVDEDAYSRAAFCFEPNSKPAHDKVKDKYLKHLATQNTKNEVKVIKTRFGDTVEVIAMNWVTTREYPYDPPTIDASKEKIGEIGPTVGVGWVFWKDNFQCGCWIVAPVDQKLDEAVAFQRAKQLMKDFAEGIEIQTKKR